MLHVPSSSFYEWRSRALTATAVRRAELAVLVGEVFTECRQTYGCRRIARELNARGTACSVGLVADLMREMGLKAVQPRAYRVTTVHGVDDEYPVDLIERDFTSQQPGTRLVGDITYLRTGQGWLYLATVIDLATRMVVGWQIADHMRTTLIVDALEMARLHGHLQPNAICHSDRGTQYASGDYAKYCARIGVRRSMGRTGVSLLTGYSDAGERAGHRSSRYFWRPRWSQVQHVSHGRHGFSAVGAGGRRVGSGR